MSISYLSFLVLKYRVPTDKRGLLSGVQGIMFVFELCGLHNGCGVERVEVGGLAEQMIDTGGVNETNLKGGVSRKYGY